MHEQLKELFLILRESNDIGTNYQTLRQNPRVDVLLSEILDVFGFPENHGFEEIIFDMGRDEPLTEELINKVLIDLADQAAFYQTIKKSLGT